MGSLGSFPGILELCAEYMWDRMKQGPQVKGGREIGGEEMGGMGGKGGRMMGGKEDVMGWEGLSL